MSFFGELRRRNVIRMAMAYAAVGWLTVEIASVVLPTFEAPGWVLKVLTFLVLLGFPAVLVFAWAFEMTPEGLKRESEVARGESTTRATGRKLDFLIIGVLAVAVIFLLVDNYWSAESPAEVPVVDDEEISIAVLPFVNMSPDKDNEYFSDGITEELLGLLARIPELRVSSRTSSFAFKGTNKSIPAVAESLGVEHILEGSVRRSGDRVRITAQLIDADSDSNLWSEMYDRELEDLFEVQDDIAQNIVAALKVTLSPETTEKLETRRVSSIDAYDLYLRGEYYLLQGTHASSLRAREMYEQAIEIDPGYALAYAGLAESYAYIFTRFDSDPAHLAKADELSRKAVKLAPDLDQAHIARGYALIVSQRYAEAEEEFEKALKLNPRSADAYSRYGQSRFLQGDFAGTATYWEKVVALNPDNKAIWSMLPQVYRSLGRDDDALEAAETSARVYERALALNPDDVNDLLGLATARLVLGDRKEALSKVEQVLDIAGEDATVLYNAACLYSLAGETDRAFETLERSVAAGNAEPDWMEQDSDLDNIRNDPRFASLLERMRAENARKAAQAGQ